MTFFKSSSFFPQTVKLQLTYENFIKYCDRCISKVILMTTLISNESEFGTRAQAQVHQDITTECIEDDALWMSDILTEQVVKPLAEYNYNFTVLPQLVIQYSTEDTSKTMAERDQILSGIAPMPSGYIYKKYNISEPADDDIVVFQGNLYKWGSIKEKLMAGESILPAAGQGIPGPGSVSFSSSEFSETGIDDIDRLVMRDTDIIDGWCDTWFDLLQEQIDKKKLEKALSDIDSFEKAIPALAEYKSKKAQAYWEKCLTAAALMGERSVQQQIQTIKESSDFAEQPLSIDNEFHFGTPEDALGYFRRKLPIPKAVWNAIDQETKQYAFYVSELEDTGLINFVKEKMIEALEKGKTFRQFAQELFDISGTWQFFGHMKTSFYTNMHSALSRQNGVSLLRNVKSFPFWRYSAVMDGKTRPAHAAMHGFVARYDDPIWKSWYPPNGYNCRCRVTIATESQYNQVDEDFRNRVKDLTVDEGFDTSPIESLKSTIIKCLNEKREYSLNLNAKIRGVN